LPEEKKIDDVAKKYYVKNLMVRKYDGDSPFAAFTAFTIGNTNPNTPVAIRPNMPNPNNKMAGILMMIYSIKLN
jgi:hypothetical protein